MGLRNKIVVIGGSAGSFQIVTYILSNLDKFPYPVILCLHRLKHIRHGFVEALNLKSKIEVIEPFDKQKIVPGFAYLAPANYHLQVELGGYFSLSTDEMINFSRPSIDVTMDTFSSIYRNDMVGIILSGANSDGCRGMAKCSNRGGFTLVQDPQEAEIKTMPEGTIKLFQPSVIGSKEEIVKYLLELKNNFHA